MSYIDLAGTPAVSKKNLSKKALLVIVLLCAVFATVALLALSTYCFYCNNRLPMQLSQIPSVKDMSYNSTANLINHRSAQFQPCQSKTCFFLKPISGKV